MSYSFYKEKEFVNTPKGAYPKAWKIDKFDSFMTLEYGKGLSESIRREGPYPVFGSNGIVGYHDEKLVKSPGIIVGRKGTIGAVTRSLKDFWPIDTTFYIKLKTDEIDWSWLYYELLHLNLPKLSSADVVPGLKRELVNNLTLPLPCLEEQKKIAGVLGVVDSAIELSDQIVAKTERLKRGLMQQLLTRGIGHTETKQTPIGNIPKEWDSVPLKDVVLSYKNGIYKPSQFAGKGLPCVRMYNIVAGKINLENAALLEVTEQELDEFGVKAGDIIVNRVNTSELVGKAGVVPKGFGKATFESKNIRMRVDTKKVSPDFLAVFVQTKSYSNQLLSRAKTAVAQATITQEDLNSVVIPLPPTLNEQEKIAEIISTIDTKLLLEIQEKERIGRIKRGLMDLLLTGKIRIKVD